MPKHPPPRRVFAPRTPGQQPGVPHFRIKMRESAATAERASLVETTLGTIGQSGRMLIQLINEGRGSSGAYPASVLQEAANSRVFSRGLAIHANHPTLEEEQNRPERNVLDWVGQLVEDARYDPVRRALIAE